MTDQPRADLLRVHVIVPLHGAASGKSRLGFVLDAEERESLVLGMAAATLAALAEWAPAVPVHLVTADLATGELMRRARPEVNLVPEPPDGGLNGALRAACDAAIEAGATAVLILPTDLPLLTAASLASLADAADAAVAAGAGRPIVAIAPADARRGTNALLLSPPDVIEPLFGELSLEAHLRAAEDAGASVQLVDDPAIGFDLDTPDDLERLDVARLLELQELGQALIGRPVEVG